MTWFKRRRKMTSAPSSDVAELLVEIQGHRAQIDSLYDALRLAKHQRDRAIVEVNDLRTERDGDAHRYWHPDKQGPYYQIQR